MQTLRSKSFEVCGIIALLLFLTGIGAVLSYKLNLIPQPILIPHEEIPEPSETEGMAVFTSENDFRDYLEASTLIDTTLQTRSELTFDSVSGMEKNTGVRAPAVTQRESATNVQVAGIDEPDIVKVSGNHLFYSSENWLYYPLIERFSAPSIMPPINQSTTKTINAYPAESMGIASSIGKAGTLLISENTLVILSGPTIYGYDITDTTNPTEKWTASLKDSGEIVSARLKDNVLYLITRTPIQTSSPCPIRPLTKNDGTDIVIPCTDIYYPIRPAEIDGTFTVSAITPATGIVADTLSFVGSLNSSVIYMSENSLFVTYAQPTDYVTFFYDFLDEKGEGLVPTSILNRLQELKGYTLSTATKLMELQSIINTYQNSLASSEYDQFEESLSTRLSEYLAVHQREFEKTKIVKIGLDSLVITGTGSIPGSLLNQFSLDEYQDNLRVATTINNSSLGVGTSVNDIYVLDESLDIIGSVLDLGKTERVYAARFIGNRGYVVTFRQTDPFYVIDLSNPRAPKAAGELKIPGYSSYLHPLAENVVLGIGMENSKVKLSLFDVHNPENPAEISKLTLDEYWSEALDNHHAFMVDPSQEIFFMPGGNAGYILSYAGNALQVKKAISDISAKRAAYINNIFYIIGRDTIIALSENDWSEVKRLTL